MEKIKKNWKKEFKDIIIINVCLFLVAIAEVVFFIPAKIGSGGIMTLAFSLNYYIDLPKILTELSSPLAYGNWSILGAAIMPIAQFLNGNDSVLTSFLFLTMNIPLLTYSLVLFGKSYFFKTIYGTIFLPFFMTMIGKSMDYFGIDTSHLNPIITVIAGNMLVGVGIGIILGKGGSTGGTDIVGAVINHFIKIIPIGTAIAIANFLIVMFYFYVIGVSKAAESIITIFLSGIIIDLVLLYVFKIAIPKKKNRFKNFLRKKDKKN